MNCMQLLLLVKRYILRMTNSKEIKLVALATIELHLSEGVNKSVIEILLKISLKAFRY